MTAKTTVNIELRDYLADNEVMEMLRTIDKLNPPSLPPHRVCTIKEVADAMGLPPKTVWKMCDKGVELGVLMYYGGMLSRKKVDLTDLGEDIIDTDSPEEQKEITEDGTE